MTTLLYTIVRASLNSYTFSEFRTELEISLKKESYKYVFIILNDSQIEFEYRAFERMINVMQDTDTDMLYSDYRKIKDGKNIANPTIDVQQGSVRNDFDFGPVILFKIESLMDILSKLSPDICYAYFYSVVLEFIYKGSIFHLNEFMYNETELSTGDNEEKHFAYQKETELVKQKEYEYVFTQYLKKINAYLPPVTKKIDYDFNNFTTIASVIIPVLNREKTISNAIASVLSQKTNFPFNLIIVDNHSTDDTSACIDSFKDERIIHIIPEHSDLGIGGCWDYAIRDSSCGMFAIQLDSDDMYSNDDVLQTIVNKFLSSKCAMVIGSYMITDSNLNPIPPGIIAHKEWTQENGHNNALRINGLGAPRAFYTPVIRNIGFPNTSYGEDYAVALRISREYTIERIYDVLYNCRRWDGNSDSNLSIEKKNMNNIYKDSIRTIELMARVKINNEK